MSSETEDADRNLEDYRDYLRLLAQLQLDQVLWGKIDVSGVVQQTMLEAYKASPKCQIQNADQMAAWLRRILANNLADEIRKMKAGKRDVSRERSLEAAMQQSSCRLEAWLVADQSSPSLHARRHEQSVLVSAALARLPETQREALLLRHFHGRSLVQIAEHLGRSHAAVAGLLKRGLQQLRDQLRDSE
ncbi:MAG: sigma-70 family RNA polymerase sigma factor [Fuerstiella sp.]|nr:sigma-70 family RNA polymerase sigma factor [Fuerstiella sp.]